MRRLGTPLTIGLLLAATHAAAGDLTFHQIFGHETQTAPRSVRWSPDGERVAYRWKDIDGVDDLWVVNAQTGLRTRLFSAGSDGGDVPSLESLDDYQWAPDSRGVLLESAGGLYLLDGLGNMRRLDNSDAEERIPRFSPDGKQIAFVRDWNLHVLDVESGEVRQLTQDGEENTILNGITDWVYWEEIWGRTTTGFWWSPDGRKIAYYRFDEREVPTYPMVDFTPLYPEVVWQKYPKAGETNPVVQVGVLDLESGQTTWLETGDETDVYLARVDWLPDNDRVAVQRLNRDQDQLDLLSCSAEHGDCSALHRETAETWINLTQDLTFFADGRFLWTSEKSGWRRLALHDANGRELRLISPEGWNVTGVDRLAGETVIYTAHSTEPLGALHRTVFAQGISEGAPRRLSPEKTWSSARVSPDGAHFVATSSAATTPTTLSIQSIAGGKSVQLPTEAPPRVDLDSLPLRKFLTIPGPQGSELPAMLVTPSDLDPEVSYPAIMYHYGGPASQVVADRWSWRERALWHSLMVQRGYVVLMVDNRASNYFGKHGHDRAHRRFGPENLAAQRAGVDFLGSLGYVNTERVGLWGGSGGGYHTLYALTNSPGTWAAGVAFAPVSDFRLYDTIWTERYFDHPEDNPDGYRDSAPTTYADQLADPLLMVHGTADDNVHPQNTLVMAQKLIEAGKKFEMSIHPRQKHGFRGSDSRHFYERMTEFFDRHLRPADSGGE